MTATAMELLRRGEGGRGLDQPIIVRPIELCVMTVKSVAELRDRFFMIRGLS
ncbi:MAG: hypothetical protein QM704_10670 [Anaeromyxobacteraceae bacterium]